MLPFFQTKIEFLKGIGPKRGEVLNKELNIFTFADLIQHYPFRYQDRSKYNQIRDIISEENYYQITGSIARIDTVNTGGRARLVAMFSDGKDYLELIWFAGGKWIVPKLQSAEKFIVYGKPSMYKGDFSMIHPEILPLLPETQIPKGWEPVYHTTEKLKEKGIDSKTFFRLMRTLVEMAEKEINETLPEYLIKSYRLCDKKTAIKKIHFPVDTKEMDESRRRLKFEELFYVQLKVLGENLKNKKEHAGQVFKNLKPRFMEFYEKHRPFELTAAQKKVIHEIREDLSSGKHMNRLLQGDVGSGKTMVAFLVMLMAVDNNAQACLMAPTETLAFQHYYTLRIFSEKIGVRIHLLTGSTRKKEKQKVLELLSLGQIDILIGTHALIEDPVTFKNLGLCIIDEQHRFGVAQRSLLWKKNNPPPHILVMTATPIPRTLAMTLYGDLDCSVINEMPKGRKPIITTHRYETSRHDIYNFIHEELRNGHQTYIVYPLIEESETLDYKHLTEGVELVKANFKNIPVSVVHGKLKSQEKDFQMSLFVKGETKIMVATNVIEVGVDVPNATIMLIESAERFGLTQLHQLRGRVGRGSSKSYCIMLTGNKLSKEGRERMEILTSTTDGFKIADEDLRMRGPGDVTGTMQSGTMGDLLISDLAQDAIILQEARKVAQQILQKDPKLENPEHACVRQQIISQKKMNVLNWSRIS